MKGNVYLLLRQGRWEARTTIAPEVDEAYWFGQEVEKRGGAGIFEQRRREGNYCGEVMDHHERTGHRETMEQCEETERRGATDHRKAKAHSEVTEHRKASEHREITEYQKASEHRETTEYQKASEHRETTGHRKATEGWLYKEELPWGQACLVADLWNSQQRDAVTGRPGPGRQHPFQRLARLVAELQERDSRRQSSGIARAGQRQLADRWGERSRGAAVSGETTGLAQLAAGLLQGRALLGCEARDLLIGAADPGAGSSWSGALQLLSLLGQAAPCRSGRRRGWRAASRSGAALPALWQRWVAPQADALLCLRADVRLLRGMPDDGTQQGMRAFCHRHLYAPRCYR